LSKRRGKGKQEQIKAVKKGHKGGPSKAVEAESECSCSCATNLSDEGKLKWAFVPLPNPGNKDAWVLQAIEDQKWTLAKKHASLWPENTEDDVCWLYEVEVENKKTGEKKKATEGAALHHIISKDKLVWINEAMSTDHVASVHKKWFWRVCMDLCGQALTDGAADANLSVKLLWNIPINLEVGPGRRAGDPGTAFDGNTVEGEDGRRELDDVSRLLLAVEEAFNPDDEMCWCTMAAALLAAYNASSAAGPGRLLRPNVEQWARDDVGVGETPPTWQKKGLRHFTEHDEAVTLFRDARAGASLADKARLAAIDADAHGEKAAVRCERTTATSRGTVFRLVATGEAIAHICRRHTYAFFVKEEIKAINNFWPEPLTFDQTTAAVDAMLADIARRAIEYWELSPDEEENWSSAELANQSVNGEAAYFIIKVAPVYPEDLADQSYSLGAWIETAAPDGAAAHAYTKSALTAIIAEVER